MYSISCYIDKVIVTEKGIESIAIKPTGRSRVDGVDKRCLGFDCGNDQVSWFPLEFSVGEGMGDAVLMARMHGKEIELKIEKTEGQTETTVKTVAI